MSSHPPKLSRIYWPSVFLFYFFKSIVPKAMGQQLMVAYLKNVPFLIFDSILFDRRILRVYCIRCWVYLSIHTSWQIPSKVFVMCVDLCVYTTRRDFHPRCNSCAAPVVVVFCAPLPADSIRFRQGRVSNMTRALVVCLPVWCEKTSRDDPDSLIKSPQWRPPNPHTHTHDSFTTERAANVTRLLL